MRGLDCLFPLQRPAPTRRFCVSLRKSRKSVAPHFDIQEQVVCIPRASELWRPVYEWQHARLIKAQLVRRYLVHSLYLDTAWRQQR